MTKKEFIDESTEWLKGFGYSVHMHSADHSMIGFWNMEDPSDSPSVVCQYNSGDPTVEVEDVSSYKMGFTLKSGKMSFKNPLFGKHLQVARHYARLVKQHPPF